MAKRYGSRYVNGEKLKRLMEKKCLFPDTFHKKANVGLRTLQKMMAGGSCDISYINRVADALGVDITALIDLPDEEDVPDDYGRFFICRLN